MGVQIPPGPLKKMSILKKFESHIKQLKRMGLLPEDWIWHPEKVKELEAITGRLFVDLKELYNHLMLDADQFRKTEVLLMSLRDVLERDLKKLRVDKKDTQLVNKLLEEIKRILDAVDEDVHSASKKALKRTAWTRVPMDNFLNARYARFQNALKKLARKGELVRWLVSFVKQYRGHGPITETDVKSAALVTESYALKTLRKKYGHHYFRPIVVLSEGDYQRFDKALYGATDLNSDHHGCIIPFNGLGFLIAKADDIESIYHELRHSIDPYLKKRIGRNKILDEVIAFLGYEVLYVGRGMGEKMVKRQEVRACNNIDEIRKTLKSKDYYEQVGWAVSFERYKREVDKLMWKLEELSETRSLEEIDKMLFNCISIDQVMKIE